ncbi:PSD1 and planctomycete cytochrome C domain-containing protein [Prosthecobacter sp.]|uniref:PSD1 and planctomycete cytochrome C domain-containing protein n=1 Tax=Prosthecobacter sp. TaxID=1965333 RepID=UPI002ABAFBD6|nr:PSD1 and planctomycete cytochrome C domain-containing protein [Prosthecobacter sp.]MDZ4404844.1 PSD1 and planctomycete cytochrome C domain-containing protein [Prosthecobacter sp.]
MRFLLFILTTSSALAANLPPDHAQRMERGLKLFQQDVAALLKENCLKCHGGEKVKSDFDMATREDLLRGGSHGSVVVPFDAKSSSLVAQINHAKEPHMPDSSPKLPEEAISKIAAWIDDGAPYSAPLIAGKKPKKDSSVVTDEDRQWWAFQPLKKVQAKSIDELLLKNAKGMTFAPAADKAVLVRRLFLDLTGLPPSEVLDTADLSDLIDALLESPRYGERWARHWLDVARYAESTGFEQDYDRPFAFHYRDFVIKALNSDMPYDQFVKWQLAGDEYEPQNPLALAATGFLGAGVFPSQITANEVESSRYDAMDDMLGTTAGGMLGLTLSCARCHDHKFDPLPTRDYYAMLSTFTTTTRMNVDVHPDGKVTSAITTMNAKKNTPAIQGATRMMICAEGYDPIVMHTQGGPFFDKTHVLKRGNPLMKDGEAVQGFLQVLSKPGDSKRWQWQPPKDAKYNGRRRSLSNWITDVDQGAGALLARVIVNRLWQHHFGTGLVPTPNDFGKTGTPCTQPELLDWLAGQLITNGWKLKPIHKMILMSRAWQQSSARDAKKEAADPANGLFMRFVPQRLEAEAIRDSMLAVSGVLDATMFGPGTRDENSKRRSIYFNIKRSQLIGSMVAFDLPEPLVSQGARPTTTVAPQALVLMNSPQSRSWAEGLAKRVSAAGDAAKQIAMIYRLCFNRVPKADEVAAGAEFLKSAGSLADYCQVVLSLNEFIYVN